MQTIACKRIRRALSVAMITAAMGFISNQVTAQALPKPDRGGVPDSKLYDYGVMGPPATPEIVAAAKAALAKPMVAGPFKPTWASVEANYKTPAWYPEAKFGIFIHWGPYSAAARHNEWYEKHMYSNAQKDWHAANFGPHETFGYKDLIPLFNAAKWNPDDWAALFKNSGARFVVPAAQHHDNYALWDSDVTPFNAKDMGPKRDLIGDLGVSVRKADMKYGVSNHGVENFTFINPTPELNDRLKAAKADLYDPKWAEFYNVADRSPAAMTRFLTDWVNRNYELIDKYQPDLLWFDNGANLRVLDPLKLEVAAYYYNSAKTWGKEVSISTKFVAYAPSNDDTKQIGSIIDFEKVGSRSPRDIRPGPWLVDDNLGSTWGYTHGMTVSGTDSIVYKLVDTVSKGGTYMLNISPMADGTIPQAQQDTLLGVGAWLKTNGEAIYGTRPWIKFGEGETFNKNGGMRFTTKAGKLYVIAATGSAKEITVTSLPTDKGKITGVKLLGHDGDLTFTQTSDGLKIVLPETTPTSAHSFKISGLKL